MLTTLLTYCTDKYRGIFKHYLRPCISKLKIKQHTHYLVGNAYNWKEGTRLKPLFILNELQYGRPVLYVDVDAKITSREVMDINALIPPEYIGACHFLDWDKWAGGCSGIIEPLTGTLFFRPSAIPLVELWAKACEHSNEPDGKVWADVIEGRQDIYPLDIKWCYINSLPNGQKGKIPCDNPLIIHYQESRNASR